MHWGTEGEGRERRGTVLAFRQGRSSGCSPRLITGLAEAPSGWMMLFTLGTASSMLTTTACRSRRSATLTSAPLRSS